MRVTHGAFMCTTCTRQKAHASPPTQTYPITHSHDPWAETHTHILSMDRQGQTHTRATFQQQPTVNSQSCVYPELCAAADLSQCWTLHHYVPQHCPFSSTNATINSGFLNKLPITSFIPSFHNKTRTTYSSKAVILQAITGHYCKSSWWFECY